MTEALDEIQGMVESRWEQRRFNGLPVGFVDDVTTSGAPSWQASSGEPVPRGPRVQLPG